MAQAVWAGITYRPFSSQHAVRACWFTVSRLPHSSRGGRKPRDHDWLTGSGRMGADVPHGLTPCVNPRCNI